MAESNDVRPFAAGESDSLFIPETHDERDAVRQQLGRVLASELFANSKRYPSLLKYIVEETLAGRASNLKERTLGVEVFCRDPSYDTNADPVVRTSAAQVRHRLTQYYGDAGHETELRIELAPGSYVPQFRPPCDQTNLARSARVQAMPPCHVQNEEITPDTVPKRNWPARWPVIAVAALFGLVLGWVVLRRSMAPDPVAAFWGPVWDNSNPIVICVPGNFPSPENPTQTSGVALPDRAPAAPLSIGDSLGLNSIAWPDATVLYYLTGFIQAHGQQYRVLRERDLPFSDLRSGPAVMVGGPFNNQWLKRLTAGYRFGYEREKAANLIRDSRNPSHKSWRVQLDAPYSSFDVDYGIFSRVWDATTEHWVVVASGIASYGTVAAGEFLTDPRYLATLASKAPKGWERKNLQVVLMTKVLNGNAGPPQILAIHVW